MGTPLVVKPLMTAHEDSADQAVTGAFLLGVVAALGLYRSRKTKIVPAWASIGCAILGLVTVILLGRSANLGGQIAHPEIRALPAEPGEE